VASERSVQAAIEGVAAHYGAVHVLVNNAGIAGINKPTHEITEQEWDHVQAINVKGVFFCTKHAIPHMKRAGAGSIIHLSSIYGLVGAPDVPPYHASKGAVRLMAKTDALIYAPDNIRVNSVHPGFIWTPMVEHHLRASGATDLAAARDDLAGCDIATHLARHGLAVNVVHRPRAAQSTGQSILMHARESHADLIVAGGYSRARALEQVFGGVTRNLLEHSPIPVLFSH
jgi:NADP-dependent 3-hydroxy acid dehydrogenase YdfG